MTPESTAARPEELLAHAGWLRALAATLVGDAASADDLVQDTWLSALRRPPRSGLPLRPWLSRVARNLARNRRRGEMRRVEHEAEAPPLITPQPADELVAELEAQRTLVEVLLALEEPLRSTVVLRYFRGLDASQIAMRQGVPPGTVRWRLKRAIDELRVRLDAHFGGSRGNWCALLAPLAARPEFALVGTAGGLGAGAIAPGVVAMGAFVKLGAALVVVATAGWWLWERSNGGSTASPQPVIAAPAPLSPVPAEIAPPVLEIVATEPGSASDRSEVAMEAPAPSPQPVAKETLAPAMVDARFIDETGAPWPGVRLAADEVPGMKPAASAPNGHAELALPWTLDARSTWTVRLTATRAGCATAVVGASLRSGETTHLGDIVLGPGTTLHGRVRDEEKQAFAGARIGITAEEIPEEPLEVGRVLRHGLGRFVDGPMTTSAVDGTFHLKGVSPGTWRVWVKAEDMRYAWSEAFEVHAGEDVYDLELVLSPIRVEDRIAGRVIDPEGRPVPRASVSHVYRTPNESGSSSLTADDAGRFELLVQLVAPYQFDARDLQNRYAPASVEEVQPGTLDLLLRLGEKVHLEARVRKASGEPIPGAVVKSGRANRSTLGDSRGEASAEGVARVAMPTYSFILEASARGFQPQTLGPFDPSTPPERVEFELQALPVLRGRVVAFGEPVPGAKVELREDARGQLVLRDGFQCVMQPNAYMSIALADAQGRFELGAEAPGSYWVRATAEGYAPGELEPLEFDVGLEPGEVEIALTRGGVIEGRVLLPDGRDGAGTIVGVNHGDGAPRTQRAGPGGAYRFEGLSPGQWQVLERDEELRPDQSTISAGGEAREIRWDCEVFAGRTTRHDLELTLNR